MLNKINTDGSFGYQGKVSIYLQQSGRKHKVHESMNKGLTKLFNGLCALLVGQPNLADVVPAKIALYALNPSDLPVSAADASWDDLKDALIPATPLCPINSSALEAGPVAHIQGNILYGHIYQDKIYVVALYPATAVDSQAYDSALAYYKLLNNGTWDEVSIDRTSIDNTFIVDWQLSFSNV